MTDVDCGPLWKLFIDGLPDFAMIILDVDGKIRGWNAGAAGMLGYSAAEAVGQNFSCLYTVEESAAGKPAMALKRAVAQGQDGESGRRVRQDGTQLEARGLLIPLYDAQEVHVGFGNLIRGTMSPVAGAASANVVPLRAKILVVDDNAEILEAVVLQLMSLGYAVVRASDGAEALEILTHDADIDLLFTDVIMPGGMNGRELAEAAKLIRPKLKVLFTSGYFEGALVRDGNIAPGAKVLSKPYRKRELARRVTELLVPPG